MCKTECLDGFTKVTIWGVQGQLRTNVTEGISTFLFVLLVEALFEFFYKAPDDENMRGWMKEALWSSLASAFFAVMISSILRVMNYQCSRERDEHREPARYFYGALILSQLASGLCAFGIGIAFDALLEVFLSHNALDSMEVNEAALKAVAAPVFIAAGKSLSRYLVFKGANLALKSCAKKDEELPLFSDDEQHVTLLAM